MTSFEDLGLNPAIVGALEDADLRRPTALQEAVIPLLRRGGNLVARASAGAGKTLAYGLPLADRLGETDPDAHEPGAASLILLPTPESATRAALALYPYFTAVGRTVSVPGAGWAAELDDSDVVVTTPFSALQGLQGAALKVHGLRTLVIDGASAMLASDGPELLEAILDHAPSDGQRILLAPEFDERLHKFAERRVKRAMHYPAAPAVDRGQAAPALGSIAYVVVSANERIEVLTRLIRRRAAGPPVRLYMRDEDRTAAAVEELTRRGFRVGIPGDAEADAVLAEEPEEPPETPLPGRSISLDVPPDEYRLRARHEGDPEAVVLLSPAELPHLRELAARARLVPKPIPVAVEHEAVSEVETFRTHLRTAIQQEDLGAQILLLSPLFEEFGPVEVAAAASALLRKRTPTTEPQAAHAPTGPSARPAPEKAPPSSWTRLFVGVGERDGVRPGDLVGAIAGEANIPGAKVGKITIRDSFSVVEVEAGVAANVIQAVNGTSIKGRSARVDYDRPPSASRPPQRRARQRRE